MKAVKIFVVLLVFIMMVNPQGGSDRIDASWDKNSKIFQETWFRHEKRIDEKFDKLESRIKKIWNRIEKTTTHEFVNYSDDAKTRIKVHFDKGYIVCETVEDASRENFYKDQMKEKVLNEVSGLANSKDGNDVAFLQGQVRSEIIQSGMKNLKKSVYTAPDNKKRVKYTMIIPLEKNHMSKRAKLYHPLALKYGNKYGIDPALLLAVMECESSFNPYADNGIAYGLMQIVPKSGGYDAAKTAFGKKMYIAPYKLKKPEVNVHLGAAHLHQSLTYRAYFKNYSRYKQKQEIMAIAGYNCGAPTVARWIKKNPDFINLPYKNFFYKLKTYVPEETKNYIVKVPMARERYRALGHH